MSGGGSGGYDSVPPPHTPIDKSRVLDVKPLRSLVPVFPHEAHPFAPAGHPFYPFNPAQHSQTPTPLRSYPPAQSNGYTVDDDAANLNGEDLFAGTSQKRTNSSSQKKVVTKRQHKHLTLSIVDDSKFVVGISLAQRDDGNRDLVNSVLMRFDALRRRLAQLEESKELRSGLIRNANMKAANALISRGVRTNLRKRIGLVPGVEVGDIFFFRLEMCLVGLHSQTMAGIDYMIVRGDSGGEEEPLALSIVSSGGGYDNEAEDSDVLIYSGQGGNVNKFHKQAADQKLVRGNLALERSLHRGNQVRVIRGVKDSINQMSKVYVYDGLYTIRESWVEKGKSGCNIFKYKLVRMPAQPAAFAVWKSIEKWKEGLSSRVGLILPDLTSGAESIPVSLVNDVDEERGPAYFTYFPTVKYSKSFNLAQPSYGCNCRNACTPGDQNCLCIKNNGGYFPYTANGVLVSRKPMVHECGSTCPCFANCKNRVSQTGLKVRLEVFKTKDRGWGLRSWDPIRSGTFICEYAGEVIDKVRQDGKEGENSDYIFDTSRIFQPFKWNCEPGLTEEDGSTEAGEEYNIPFPLIISAKNIGNVARFMNHGCEPNIFWQPIIYEHNDQSFIHIAFFAMTHIPPMTELTYDYGTSRSNDTNDENAPNEKKKCFCGSPRCQGYFG